MPPTIPFAAFVLWLLAVPMDGPLTTAIGISEATRYFLLPHAVALALIGAFCPPQLFNRLAPIGTGVTVLLTLLLPLRLDAAPWLLLTMSLSAAFVAIAAGRQLHRGSRPVLSAALGLVTANLLLFCLHLSSGADSFRFALVALPLLLISLSPPRTETSLTSSTTRLWHYLPFVLVFHIVGGLMYSAIYPAYIPVALQPGAELPFYMATVIIAVWLVGKNRELPLLVGIILGMAAFALLQWSQPLYVNLSMFAMQAGQGFVDLFLLAFLLAFTNPIQAFGFGLATLCLGIHGGQLIGGNMKDLAGTIAMTGHIVLNLSVLTLYFFGRHRSSLQQSLPPTASHSRDIPPATDLGQPQYTGESATNTRAVLTSDVHVPENIRLLLSEREYLVLIRSLEGRTYRDIATDLKISESSVKTYMKRICDKLETPGRKGLFAALAGRHIEPGPKS